MPLAFRALVQAEFTAWQRRKGAITPSPLKPLPSLDKLALKDVYNEKAVEVNLLR